MAGFCVLVHVAHVGDPAPDPAVRIPYRRANTFMPPQHTVVAFDAVLELEVAAALHGAEVDR